MKKFKICSLQDGKKMSIVRAIQKERRGTKDSPPFFSEKTKDNRK